MGKTKQEIAFEKISQIFQLGETVAKAGDLWVAGEVMRFGIAVAKGRVPIAATQSESWVLSASSDGKRFALVVRVGPANAVKPS